tara:strand:+ start:248 stop:745 length:498 start_codon:yes stop_codon:yes gene_type:complete
MSPPPDRFVEGWHDLDIYGSLTQELKEEIERRNEIQIEKSAGSMRLQFKSSWNPSDSACTGIVEAYLENNGVFQEMLGARRITKNPTRGHVVDLMQEFRIDSGGISFRSSLRNYYEELPSDVHFSEYRKFVNAIIWAYIRRHDVIKENSIRDIIFGIEKFEDGLE